MITEDSPEVTRISFADWTRGMLALAIKLHRLPRPHGEPPTHEIGIDRLQRLTGGDLAIAALFDLVDDFDHCPDHREVVRLGKAIVKSNLAFDRLLAKNHMAPPPAPKTGKVGFVRRR